MWVIARLDFHEDINPTLSSCCYTLSSIDALEALDKYTTTHVQQLCGDYSFDPWEDNPSMPYLIEIDESSPEINGESSRLFIKQKSTGRLLHSYEILTVDKYIKDYLIERTPAVIELERDDHF